jgi:hypothetical protein
MKHRKKWIIIIGAAALLAVAAGVLILIGHQEHDVTFMYYDTFLPLDEGQQYIIDEEHTNGTTAS